MAQPITRSNVRRGLAAWTTRDLLVTAVIGIALGAAILIPFVYLYAFIQGLGPLAVWALTGIPFLPSLFVAYVVRRPGAGIVGQLIAGLTQLPFTPLGLAYLISAIIRAILCEPLVALVTRYRHFSLGRIVLLGALTGALFFAVGGLLLRTVDFAPTIVATIGALAVGSCAISAVCAKYLTEAIARTDVLSRTALAGCVMDEV